MLNRALAELPISDEAFLRKDYRSWKKHVRRKESNIH